MKEVSIRCLCDTYQISDLGISCRRGDTLWLEESKARSSVDLVIAQRAGAVQVTWGQQRCSMARPPLPPFVKRLNKHVRMPQPTPAPVTPPPEPSLNEQLVESFRDVVREEIQKALLNHSGSIDKGSISSAVRTAMFEMGGAYARKSDPDEPIFIPSKIVSGDDQTTINVTSVSSESNEVESASAALKSARKNKRN